MYSPFQKLTASLLLVVYGNLALPVGALYAAYAERPVLAEARETEPAPPPPVPVLEAPSVVANRRAVASEKAASTSAPRFSSPPTRAEIFNARLLSDPLVPTGPVSVAETTDLAAAITQACAQPADLASPFSAFLASHPSSGWAASVHLNLGLHDFSHGWLSRAISRYESAWRLSREARDLRGRAVADRAFAELVRMHARLGRKELVAQMLAEVETRAFTGSATELVASARDGLGLMKDRPDLAFRCGPGALDRILARRDNTPGFHPFLAALPSTENGTSLAQVAGWGVELGLKMRPAFRAPGAAVLTPAVMHWKLGHFSAIFAQTAGSYAVEDPTFLASGMVLSAAAADAEASGYFLVPDGPLPAGWREVDATEAATVWGKGNTGVNDINRTGSQDHKSKGDCDSTGMPVANAHTMAVSLNIEDTPVGYSPPYGPAFSFRLTYNQREASQPAIPDYSNLGPKWVHNWLSFVDETIVPVGDHTVPDNLYPVVRPPGGGSLVFDPGTALPDHDNASFPNPRTRETRSRISKASDVYVVTDADGSRLVFGRKVGLASPFRYFLTEVEDSLGHKITLSYDSQNRLVAVTDALGQVSTLSYEFAADPLLITKVEDPFGRHAVIAYDDNVSSPSYGRLVGITDTLGLASTFSYQGSGDFIQSMTTPYGTTSFAYGESGTGGRDRWLEITDPLGDKERVECRNYWPGLAGVAANPRPAGMTTQSAYQEYRNTLYWDKKAYRESYNPASPDQAHTLNSARVYHWLHAYAGGAYNQTSGTLENVKSPLESARTWYNYAGQTDPVYEGTGRQPLKVGRVLDDGTSQVIQYEYNVLGNITKVIDPLGRTTVQIYDTNNIDLLEVRQITGSGPGDYQRLFAASGYVSHLPATVTDAAGQTTTYLYNSKGQLSQVTNPKGEVTRYYYDPTGNPAGSRLPGGERDPAAYGYLVAVDGPATGTADTSTILYDAYGRPRTTIDVNGYAVTTDYDVFDRPILVTYPDATTTVLTYDRLDLVATRDRSGDTVRTAYNAIRQPVLVTDPLGRTTQFAYCKCGDLRLLVDAAGNRTTWTHDAAGRVTSKVFPDQKSQFYNYETATSRLKSVTDAKGQIATYSYHKDNALAGIAYSGSTIATPAVSYTYDTLFSRLASHTDGQGTTLYGYYAIPTGPNPAPTPNAGRLQTVDGPWTDDTISYTYDELGRPLQRSINGAANTETVTYDSLGRLATITNPLGAFTYGYVEVTGRLDHILYPNGQRTDYAYHPATAAASTGNGDFRLQSIHNQTNGGAHLSTFAYTYDTGGLIQTWSRRFDADSTLVSSFKYDAADQLTEALVPGAVTGTQNYVYRYDRAGNRTSEQIGSASTAATHNGLNQLQTLSSGGPIRFEGQLNEAGSVAIAGQAAAMATDHQFAADLALPVGTNTVAITATDNSGNVASQSYEVTVAAGSAPRALAYDLNGNLVNNGAGQTYEWDAADRMIAIQYADGARSEFSYDATGRRYRIMEKDAAGLVASDKRFVWDGLSIAEERDSANTVVKRFYGQGRLLGSNAQFYTRDHLGSIRDLTDATGALQARYDYDPYGRVTKIAGADDSDFLYTGHYFHSHSELHLAPYRAYDTETGRWLSRDPIEENGGLNLYGYTGSDPINAIDPLGLSFGSWVLRKFGFDPDARYAFNSLGALDDADTNALLEDSGTSVACVGSNASYQAASFTVEQVAITAATYGAGKLIAAGAKAAKQAWDNAAVFHHAFPKYLGGKHEQILEPLPRRVHVAYHRALNDAGLIKEWGTRYWSRISPTQRQLMRREFEKTTKAFDKAFGTSLWDAAKREGF